MNNAYVSDIPKWESDADYMTFFLIPRKWWSIQAWKLAFSFRGRLLEELVQKATSKAKE